MGQEQGGRVTRSRGEQVPADGAAIRAAREAKGWSRKKLAAELAVSSKTIQRYETGHRRPTRATVLRLMALLGLSLADLRLDLSALLPAPHAPPVRR